jgi:hypothetical protein
MHVQRRLAFAERQRQRRCRSLVLGTPLLVSPVLRYEAQVKKLAMGMELAQSSKRRYLGQTHACAKSATCLAEPSRHPCD